MKKYLPAIKTGLKWYAYIIAAVVTVVFLGGVAKAAHEKFFGPLQPGAFYKPVIYLYPEKETEATVKLFYQGKLTVTYPAYDEVLRGWKVIAHPDGKLINLADQQPYSYLFWEGDPPEDVFYDLSQGFVVAGKDTASFLQKKLKEIGLSPAEYNEFIVYWVPRMKDNAYNLIHFAGEEYTETAPLQIEPKPDSLLRVFMVFRPLDAPVEVEPQEIKPFVRKGFTVIEWGGTEVR